MTINEAPSVIHKSTAAASYFFWGCASLGAWNSLLNVLYDIQIYFLEGQDYTDLITGVYMSAVLLSNLALLFVTKPRPIMILIGMILVTLLVIMLPLTIGYSDSVDVNAGSLISVSVIIGIILGYIQPSGFACAGAIPDYNFVTYMSAGLAGVGFLTFILWIIFSVAVFDLKTDALSAMWSMFSCVGIIYIISTILTYILFYKIPFTSQAFRQAKNTDQPKESFDNPLSERNNDIIQNNNQNVSHCSEIKDNHKKESDNNSNNQMDIESTTNAHHVNVGSESFLKLLSLVKYQLISISVTNFSTLSVFPNIFPILLSNDRLLVTVCIGTYQIGDLLGRAMLTWNKLNDLLMKIPPWIILIIAILRGITVILYSILAAKYPTQFLNSFAFQTVFMLLVASSYGTITTISLSTIPPRILEKHQPKHAMKITTFAVVVLLASITVGLWTTKLFKLAI